jgi:glycosyltransferase involved in cell wall biosynthesis
MSSLALFTSEFPFGQQETFLESELDYLSENFDNITIVPLFKHSKVRNLKYSNVSIATPVNSSRNITAHKLILLFSIVFWKVLFLERKDIGFNLKSLIKAIKQSFIVARMKKYIEKRDGLLKADLWYFYWGTNSVNVLSFLDKLPVVIARYHRYDLYGEDIDGGEPQFLQKRTLAKLSQAIFISAHGKEYMRSRYNEFAHKLFVSRLGVPFNGMASSSGDKVLRIVSCSNLYVVKRVIKIAEALQGVNSFQIEWTHIGDGIPELRSNLLSLTKQLPENIKFNFLGRINNSQIMDYYKSNPIDLFINVSVSEGVPVSIMEALSFGIPVIATNVGGTGELVNEKCGELIDPYFETSELAQSIRNFYRIHYNSEDMRVAAYSAWKYLASADNNYGAFVKSLLDLKGYKQDLNKSVVETNSSLPLN